MDFGPKDIARAVGLVVVIAIFVYLYYDRRNTLKRKLAGRDRGQVLNEQIVVIKRQMDAMQEIMGTYLALFQNGRECALNDVHEVLAPLYAELEKVADNTELIEELFDDDTLKLAGSCQRLYNDFGFRSYFFDMLGAFGTNPAPPHAEKTAKSAYQAFAQMFDPAETVVLKPEKYAGLEKMAADFGDAKQRLFARLDQKLLQTN